LDTARIDPRAVAKTVAIALGVIALALLLVIVALHVRSTIRWVAASVFVALALAPAVALLERRVRIRGHALPRWLAIIAVYIVAFILLVAVVVLVAPGLVREVEMLGQQLPTYVRDFEAWAEQNGDFQELNQRFDLTRTLNEQVANLPSRLGDAANELRVLTVALLRNVLGAVLVGVLAFFMLLSGGNLFRRTAKRLPPDQAERVLRVGNRIYAIVGAYVTINVVLAIAAGLFTWIVLELLGVEIAVPLAISVALLDLIPLIGLTIGGAFVAVIAAIHSFPDALIIWVVLFLIYQQLQDRVVQPMLYGKAVQIHPLIAIIVLLMGAQVAGILGALLAIPTAAAIGVIVAELFGNGAAENESSNADETPADSDSPKSPTGQSGPDISGAAPPKPV
jgi:predicted PurR-regulated permease PerM